MRILTVSCFSPLWKRYPANVLDLEEGMSIGGGEENFLRCSSGLRALGHEVVAYHCGERGVWRGVEFRTLEDPLYPVIVGEKWDAIAAWSGLRALEYARPGVKRLFVQQLNDLSTLGDWSAVDCIVSPSLDHTKEVRKWGWEGRQAYVHNGCDLDQYQRVHHSGLTTAGAEAVQGPNRKALFIGGEGWSVSTGEDAPKWEDRPMDVGYWSSPDRGLHHLLRAWPTVVKLEPRARLHVFYEIKNYLKFIHILPASFYGERGQTVARLVLDRMYDPTITFHGHVPRKQLAKIQRQCRVMCYPYEAFGYCEGFCHPAGTLVMTIEGLKPVERLTLQDLVLGKSGMWRPVTAMRSRRYEGSIIRVRPACGETVEMTADHPVFASDDGVSFGWVPAERLKPGMWLHSVTARDTQAPESIDLPTREISPVHARGAAENFGGKPPLVLPMSIPLTPELCRLVGYFAGDGNAAQRRGRNASTVSFFLGTEHKTENIGDIQRCLLSVFGVPSEVKDFRPAKQMVSVKVESTALAHVFATWGYADDRRKRLPEWAMCLPIDLTTEVLKGLWRTDGSVVFNPEGSRLASFTSTSPYLIGQARTLVGRLGRAVKIFEYVHGNGDVSRALNFSIAGAFLDYPDTRKNERGPEHYTKMVDGGVALRIREVEQRGFVGPVYALTVDADESYHVGNFLVHNCGSLNQSLAAGCFTMSTARDALPSLYGDAVHWLDKDSIDPNYPEWLAEQIVQGLHGKLPDQEAIRARGPKRAYTWDAAALQMEAVCRGEWL